MKTLQNLNKKMYFLKIQNMLIEVKVKILQFIILIEFQAHLVDLIFNNNLLYIHTIIHSIILSIQQLKIYQIIIK
jgi:hypothetical protein